MSGVGGRYAAWWTILAVSCCQAQWVLSDAFASEPEKGPVLRTVPEFALNDAKGVKHRSKDIIGQPLILVLNRGIGCLHCLEQVQELIRHRDAIRRLGAQVVVVTSDDEERLGAAYRLYTASRPMPFLLLSDGDATVFRKLRCYSSRPLHGTFVVDARGRIVASHVGEEPFLQIEVVLKEVASIGAIPTK